MSVAVFACNIRISSSYFIRKLIGEQLTALSMIPRCRAPSRLLGSWKSYSPSTCLQMRIITPMLYSMSSVRFAHFRWNVEVFNRLTIKTWRMMTMNQLPEISHSQVLKIWCMNSLFAGLQRLMLEGASCELGPGCVRDRTWAAYSGYGASTVQARKHVRSIPARGLFAVCTTV